MRKEEATPAEVKFFGNLEKAVIYLIECRNKGQNVYVDFNGHRLYSCDVTMDSAYIDVVGVTKAEDDAMKDEFYKTESEEEQKAIISRWTALRKKYSEEKKRSAELAEVTSFGNLDKAVEYLLECRKLGKNVYIDFNGHKLYSADVTIDSAYLAVVGMTKKQDEEIREAMDRATTEEEKDALIKKWNDIRRANQGEKDSKVKEDHDDNENHEL